MVPFSVGTPYYLGIMVASPPRRLVGWVSAVQALLSPRGESERAATLIQRHARRWLARRYRTTMRRLVILMTTRERRAAMLIQDRWRARPNVSPQQTQAIARIQAHAKGRLERRGIKLARERRAESRAAEIARMVDACTAVLEKQGRRLSLGWWEVLVWQERYVYATESALVYQHVKANAEPTGAARAVPFDSMLSIKALAGDVVRPRAVIALATLPHMRVRALKPSQVHCHPLMPPLWLRSCCSSVVRVTTCSR